MASCTRRASWVLAPAVLADLLDAGAASEATLAELGTITDRDGNELLGAHEVTPVVSRRWTRRRTPPAVPIAREVLEQG